METTTIKSIDNMLKDIGTSGKYQGITQDGDEYVLHYEETWAVHGEMESDSIDYDSREWEMRVPKVEMLADLARYSMIKTIIDAGQIDELIEMMFDDGDFNSYMFLMSYESLSLIAYAIEERVKEFTEDTNIDQEVEMYALASRRMKMH